MYFIIWCEFQEREVIYMMNLCRKAEPFVQQWSRVSYAGTIVKAQQKALVDHVIFETSNPIKTELEAEIFQPNISITWKVEFQL